MTRGLCYLILMVLNVSVLAQLPPDVEADRQIRKASRQMEDGKYDHAATTLEGLAEFAETQALTLPPDYWLVRAKALIGTDRLDEAERSIAQFLELTEGKDGDRYSEAIELLDRLDQVKEAACDLPLKVSDQIIESLDEPVTSISWSGFNCDGPAYVWEGRGEIVAESSNSENTVSERLKLSGEMRGGEREGAWTETRYRRADNRESNVLIVSDYSEGVRHGNFSYRSAGYREEGSYVRGLKQGQWTIHFHGCVYAESYLDDVKEGTWTTKCDDGTESVRNYKKGKEHGRQWTYYVSGELVIEVSWFMVMGQKHGLHTHNKRGRITRTLYVNDDSVAALYPGGMMCVLGDRSHIPCPESVQQQIMQMFDEATTDQSLLMD